MHLLNHDLRLVLAASTVDEKTGLISGATVAKAGVPAIGKFVYLRRDGSLTADPEADGIVEKLQVVTDDKTLETMLAAIEVVGGRLKVRVDHDDSIGARVGYAEHFRRDGDRISCDISAFDSSPHRALVLETAKKDGANVGLSCDLTPTFEVIGGRAVMRVQAIKAVDIVDRGAITPGGLFLSARVDNETESKGDTPKTSTRSNTMPEETKEPTTAEIMSALSTLAGQVKECLSAVAKLAAPPVAEKAAAEGELSAAQLSAVSKVVNESIGAMKAEFGKEAAALGLKGGGVKLAAGAELEKKPADEKPKTYLELVDEKVAGSAGKLSRNDAHSMVMNENRQAYLDHLTAKGIRKA